MWRVGKLAARSLPLIRENAMVEGGGTLCTRLKECCSSNGNTNQWLLWCDLIGSGFGLEFGLGFGLVSTSIRLVHRVFMCQRLSRISGKHPFSFG